MRFNLTEARMLINEYIAHNKTKLSESETSALNELLVTFDIIEKDTISLLYPHYNDPSYFANNTTDIILLDFKKNSTDACNACRDKIIDLKQKIEKFKQNTKDETFLGLLNSIEDHTHGIFLNATQEKNFLIDDIYKMSRALGGFFIPSSQDLDPLMGMEKDDTGAWIRNTGECYGLTKQQAKEIKEFGIALPSMVVKESVNKYQDKQARGISVLLEGAKGYVDKRVASSLDRRNDVYDFVVGALKNLKHGVVYKADFYTKTNAHAMYFRRIPATTFIEYYDPNVGRFYFKNDEQFKYFYTYLISIYRRLGTRPHTLRFIPIEENIKKFDNTHIIFPKHPEAFSTEELCAVAGNFLEITTFFQVTKNWSTADSRVTCHDAFLALIESIRDMKSLQALLQILNADGMFKINGKDSDELIGLRQEIARKEQVLTLSAVSEKQAEYFIKPSPTKFSPSHFSFFPIINDESIFEKERIKAANFLNTLTSIIKENFDEVKIGNQLSPIPKPEVFYSLVNYINEGKNLFKEQYNQELTEKYFKDLLALIKETQKRVSSSISYAPKNKNMADTVLVKLEQQTISFNCDLSKISIMHNYNLLTLNVGRRIQADKDYINAILKKMSGWMKLHEAIPGISTLPMGKNLKLLEQLKQIAQKEYVDYRELEKDVHSINRDVINFKFGELHVLLNNFFEKHLKLSNYNKESKEFHYEEPPIQKEKLEADLDLNVTLPSSELAKFLKSTK